MMRRDTKIAPKQHVTECAHVVRSQRWTNRARKSNAFAREKSPFAFACFKGLRFMVLFKKSTRCSRIPILRVMVHSARACVFTVPRIYIPVVTREHNPYMIPIEDIALFPTNNQ